MRVLECENGITFLRAHPSPLATAAAAAAGATKPTQPLPHAKNLQEHAPPRITQIDEEECARAEHARASNAATAATPEIDAAGRGGTHSRSNAAHLRADAGYRTHRCHFFMPHFPPTFQPAEANAKPSTLQVGARGGFFPGLEITTSPTGSVVLTGQTDASSAVLHIVLQ